MLLLRNNRIPAWRLQYLPIFSVILSLSCPIITDGMLCENRCGEGVLAASLYIVLASDDEPWE